MPDQGHGKPTAVERDLGALEARRGPFAEGVEATRTPMLVTDAQGPGSPVIHANGAFLRPLGRGPEGVVGRPLRVHRGRARRLRGRARIEAALASHAPAADDVLFRAKDGREVWVSQDVEPMEEDGRVVRHFASFFYDITERLRRERALHGERETLERRVAARTRRLGEVVERRRPTEATPRDGPA